MIVCCQLLWYNGDYFDKGEILKMSDEIIFKEGVHYRGSPCKKCGCDIRYISDGNCVPCKIKYNTDRSKRLYEENPEPVKEYQKSYYEENKEYINARNYQWKIRTGYNEKYVSENTERVKQIKRNWYLRNKERLLEESAQRYLENKEEIQARNKIYRQKNAESIKVRNQNRRALKKNAEGNYTKDEWDELCEKYDNKCLACGKKTKLTVDHIIPLDKNGTNYIWNIQGLCISCNCSKQNKIIDYRPIEDIPKEFKEKLERILAKLDE